MNFLHTPRISFESVAENIMTCLWAGVARKIDWTSLRMSERVSSIQMTCTASLTRLIQHLVTLVENEVLQIGEAEMTITDKRIDTTGRSNDDMGVSVLVGKQLDVFLDGCTSVENANLDIRQELGEAVVLIPDLVRQLTGVAHDQDSRYARLWLLVHLLEGCQHEDGCFTKTGLGLAQDIVTEDSLRDRNLLH